MTHDRQMLMRLTLLPRNFLKGMHVVKLPVTVDKITFVSVMFRLPIVICPTMTLSRQKDKAAAPRFATF